MTVQRSKPSTDRVVCLLSGGMDSATLLAYLLATDRSVIALSVDYGQKHVYELNSARKIAEYYTIRHIEIDAKNFGAHLSGSSQTDPFIDVPKGHYADESMKITVVPNRNMLLLSLAAGIAISEGTDKVAYAAHAGDHAIYPDCRPQFANAMDAVLRLCHFYPIFLLSPFIRMTKADIVREGARLHVPYALTYSCYEGLKMHCGECGTCTERKEAFIQGEVPDPTDYRRDE